MSLYFPRKTFKDYLSIISIVLYRIQTDFSVLREFAEYYRGGDAFQKRNRNARLKVKKCLDMEKSINTLYCLSMKGLDQLLANSSETGKSYYSNRCWYAKNADHPDTVTASLLSIQEATIVLSDTIRDIQETRFGDDDDDDEEDYACLKYEVTNKCPSGCYVCLYDIWDILQKCSNQIRLISLLSYRVDSALTARHDQLEYEKERDEAIQKMLHESMNNIHYFRGD